MPNNEDNSGWFCSNCGQIKHKNFLTRITIIIELYAGNKVEITINHHLITKYILENLNLKFEDILEYLDLRNLDIEVQGVITQLPASFSSELSHSTTHNYVSDLVTIEAITLQLYNTDMSLS